MAYTPSRGPFRGRSFESRWQYRQTRARAAGYRSEYQLLGVTRTPDYKAAIQLRKDLGKPVSEQWRLSVLKRIAQNVGKIIRERPIRSQEWEVAVQEFPFEDFIEGDEDDAWY